jgi:hypothetical protein
MAERVLNLNNFKSSGVYTIEIDQSENLILPLTSGRLVIGSSRQGPFNTIVLIRDVRTLRAVYGEKDPKLEKNGSFFHRSIEVALREGPVFAMNILPVDTEQEVNDNLDNVYFTTFNSETASNNEDSSPYKYPLVEFFNRRRLWFADDEQLNKTKNIALGDDYITNPSGFGSSSVAANKILSLVNTGKRNLTIWVKKANVSGFDLTAKEWYSTIGEDVEFPNFIHQDDFISDYFVEAIIVEGDWTNNIRLSKDPVYQQFFNEEGLIDSKLNDFSALREVNIISRVTGCLIPDFKDQTGTIAAIDTLINRLFPVTGVLAALDADKLELVDLENDTFNDVEVETHRVDIVGHGYDELNSGDVYVIDDGGFESDLTTPADPTPLIDVLSYSKPGDDSLVYNIVQTNVEGDFTGVGSDDIIRVTAGTDYVIALENSLLYKAYVNGFVKNGDTLEDGGVNPTQYIKIQDGFIVNLGGTDFNYIKLFTYQDVSLLNQAAPNTYVVGIDEYFNLIIENGDEFKKVFDLADTNYFTDFLITQPNILTLGINTANTTEKAEIDEYIKVNHYIKARTTAGRDRLLKILSVSSREELSPYRLEYTVTTMVPGAEEVTGLDTTNNMIQVYKGVYNFTDSLKGQYMKGFTVREGLLPNKTAARQVEILKYLYDFTSIPQALADRETIDFRYIVDTYEGEISSSSKYYLSRLAADNGKAMALLNTPSMEQFERSVDPSFIDRTSKLVSAELIAQGGDLSLNPSFTFKFAEQDVKGVPLSSYSYFVMPNLLVREGGKNKSIPPAAYVSNAYARKFKNGTPFLIVGGKRGVISDPEVVGLEYDLTNEDRDFLEPIGHNLIVKRRGFGITIFSNNTAYQRVNSALNNAHVRDNLSTIERDIEQILVNFLFDFNDEITRIRVRTLVENYLDRVVNARGLSSYSIVFDSSNNPNEVISANTAIIDILVDFPRGIHKFINRITITRVGGELSSESTGFTPSF